MVTCDLHQGKIRPSPSVPQAFKIDISTCPLYVVVLYSHHGIKAFHIILKADNP